MKKIFLPLLLFASQVYAESFYPVGKLGATTIYVDKASCEKIEGQTCQDVTDCPIDICVLKDGVYQKDATLEAQKDAEMAARESAEAAKAARLQRVRTDCVSQTGFLKDQCEELLKIIDGQ